MFVFLQISKKNKYQTKIIETPILINKMKEILLHTSANPEIPIKISKIIMNISKNNNSQNKLKFENSLNQKFYLIYNLLMTFSYLNESKEIMGNIMNLI